jgi:hypothetical protein
MTTNQSTTEETIDIVDDGDEGGLTAPKPLREAYNRIKDENRRLKAEVMLSAYEGAGLDPTKGLGKAIAKEYDGEPSKEALLEFAKTEYGYEPPSTTQHEQTVQITEGNRRIEQVVASSGSSVPLTDKEALRKASAEGDLVTAGRIKAAKLRALLNH